MKIMKSNSSFFISDKTQIMVSFAKNEFEKSNTKDDLNMYLLRSYIRFHCTVSGQVCTTLNAITLGCGSSIKGNSKVANEKFRDGLLWLQQNKYISCNKDLVTIKNSEYFEIQILDDCIFYCDKNFVLLTMSEYETIINSNTTSKKSILLATYLCIKKNIYHNDSIPMSNLAIHSHDTIKRVLGVSSNSTVRMALSELRELGLVYWEDTQYYYKNKKDDEYKFAKSVYALNKSDLKYTKSALMDFYQVDCIYTVGEINK